ncbi:hypothetical protein An07g03310 [Aspergillus niger]|uniref:Uncharacterized protein n=2 Tax=Aspergillus niger TaxID=5061 RepID=A2QMU1_ASPNC|nr:hypothetical protein An07g03310 [Aspergillus niger]CAL00265.1 hypothetical protein An07g03310 [Aspergillus niger]
MESGEVKVGTDTQTGPFRNQAPIETLTMVELRGLEPLDDWLSSKPRSCFNNLAIGELKSQEILVYIRTSPRCTLGKEVSGIWGNPVVVYARSSHTSIWLLIRRKHIQGAGLCLKEHSTVMGSMANPHLT